jgi:hypothetical protein
MIAAVFVATQPTANVDVLRLNPVAFRRVSPGI